MDEENRQSYGWIYTAGLVIIIGVAVLLFAVLRNQPNLPGGNGEPGGGSLPGGTHGNNGDGTPGGSTGTTTTPGDGPRVSVKTKSGGTISVNDFYKTAVEIDEDKSALVEVTPEYRIFYYSADSSFSIVLYNPDAQAAREAAEKGFLEELKITKAQACELIVNLGIPYSVNPVLSGIDYNLSFCPDGIDF